MKNLNKNLIKISVVLCFVFVVTQLFVPAGAATTVTLNSAGNFAVLGGSGISNSAGPTTITGDVGSYPTVTQTGFDSVTLIGTNHFGDSITQTAKTDLSNAYGFITGKSCTVDLTGQDLGGLTLTPGVYCFSTSAQLTGALLFDGLGDPNAEFIIKIGSTLITASSSSVNLQNGAQAANVYWQVGSSATLGTGTNLKGNIMAFSSITDNGGSIIAGRLLALNALVTLNNTIVTKAISEDAHIIVIKHVVNDNGGSALASAFSTTISGVTTATPTAVGAEFPGVDNLLTSIGAYSVDEGAHVGYAKTLSADCSGTIAVGETKTCTITNDDLPDITPPSAISNLALSGATTSSIVLTWTAPGDDTNTGTATLYDIRYSTSPIVTAGDFTAASLVSGEPAPAVAGTVQNMTVTGLSANTLYYFAMKTSDEVPNISTVSNIPSLSTAVAPDIIPPAAINNLALSGATTSSIVLTWTAPGDDTNTGTATLYDIRYSTSPIVTAGDFTAASLVSGEPAPAVAGTVQNMTVIGLSSNTLYYFALKTSDEVPNISTVSNIPSLSTAVAPDIIPPAAINNLALSGATTSSIVLTWTAPGDDTNTGTATLYDIRYSTSPIVTAGDFTAASLVSGEPAPAVAGTVQSMTVTGLSANTSYYFAMKTSDEVPNISTVSNIPSLSTAVAPDIIPPAAISNLALSGATTSSIVLTWTAPGDDTNTGTATLYDIRYATSPIVTAGDFTAASLVSGEPAPAVAGTVQNMTVTGLSANTLYYFAMKTSDEVPNISAVSNIPSLSTAVAPDVIPPSAISSLALSGATTSTMVLTWTAPGDNTNTGTATLYDIRYSTSPIVTAADFTAASLVSGEPAPAVAGTVQNMTVTGLSAGRLYYFAMKTSDEAPNISAVSNIASLATISNISGGSVPDTTGPINSNISAASITQSSVIITWQTNEISNSLVRFGPTSAIGGTAFDEVLDTKHLVPITGLTIDTIYHYTVCSNDSSGNQSCSGEFTFKTLSANAPLPTYSSADELASSLTINIDKGLSAPLTGTASCVSGTLIKLQSDGNFATQVDSTVYYCGADGNRYVFPNLETYLSWYPDFSNIVIVSLDKLASIPIVGNVTYRPGRFLAKVQSDFKVYAIAKGGVLRWITSEAVAQSLYGLLWKNLINDIPATFFANYILGAPITPADVAPAIPAGL